MDIYSGQDVIPLTYTRVRNGVLVTGLTVTVTVTNAKTNATILASVACPETATGSGVYTYNWAHGIQVDTSCFVTYSVGTFKYAELIEINTDQTGNRAGF